MRPDQMTRSTHALIALLGALALAAAVPAGELEPPAPPAPTMKSLDEVPPTWSQLLDSTNGEPGGCNSSRFRCVMGDLAVLDLETGLAWERAPSTELDIWVLAIDLCVARTTGGRRGWRLPRLEELLSLIDPSQASPSLPPGHPFLVLNASYWTATTDWQDTRDAWFVTVTSGLAHFGEKLANHRHWCVRGGEQSLFTSQPNSTLEGSLEDRE